MSVWKGKTAIITGAGSGIGRALALALAERGARVVVTDVDAESARAVAAECGASASGHQLDVRSAEAVLERVTSTARAEGRLDYLFNNAGIGIAGEAQEIPLEAWDRIIDVNLRGVVHGVVAAYPLMVKQGAGHIINTASLAGLGPAPLLTPYSMTKHAVVGLSSSLRIEAAAYGVRVSALCPAAIETPLLDKEHPADLPGVAWRPDVRGYLTRAAGPPYPVDKLALEALAAIEQNQGVIVIPGRARLLWRLTRLSPWLGEQGGLKGVRDERARRGKR